MGGARGADPDVASPIRRAELAKTPVFLFHGKADARVPGAQSVGLAELLDELSKFLRAVDAA